MRSRETGAPPMALAIGGSIAICAVLLLPAPPAGAQPLDAVAVRAAASAVEADPLMPGWESGRTLRFKPDEEDGKAKPRTGDAVGWWAELISNLNTGTRIVVWLLGAGLLIAVLLRLREWVLAHGGGGAALQVVAPTHVGTLDIRPQSLPDDVGAAARALWQRGEPRAALSLLYRAALSRLVHGHGVPIRAASTERDCLRLAAARLPPDALGYLRALVACWQAIAYGGREPAADEIERLCARFDAELTRDEA